MRYRSSASGRGTLRALPHRLAVNLRGLHAVQALCAVRRGQHLIAEQAELALLFKVIHVSIVGIGTDGHVTPVDNSG